ncbi:MAG: hypothetical protein FalmKO_33830 [Falsiruegeria mediterranea]
MSASADQVCPQAYPCKEAKAHTGPKAGRLLKMTGRAAQKNGRKSKRFGACPKVCSG